MADVAGNLLCLSCWAENLIAVTRSSCFNLFVFFLFAIDITSDLLVLVPVVLRGIVLCNDATGICNEKLTFECFLSTETNRLPLQFNVTPLVVAGLYSCTDPNSNVDGTVIELSGVYDNNTQLFQSQLVSQAGSSLVSGGFGSLLEGRGSTVGFAFNATELQGVSINCPSGTVARAPAVCTETAGPKPFNVCNPEGIQFSLDDSSTAIPDICYMPVLGPLFSIAAVIALMLLLLIFVVSAWNMVNRHHGLSVAQTVLERVLLSFDLYSMSFAEYEEKSSTKQALCWLERYGGDLAEIATEALCILVTLVSSRFLYLEGQTSLVAEIFGVAIPLISYITSIAAVQIILVRASLMPFLKAYGRVRGGLATLFTASLPVFWALILSAVAQTADPSYDVVLSVFFLSSGGYAFTAIYVGLAIHFDQVKYSEPLRMSGSPEAPQKISL